MIRTIATESDIAGAAAALVAIEPRFGAVVERHGLPPLRRAEPGLAGLLRIVTEQMLSLKAADAIWRRILAGIDPHDPGAILRRREAALMKLGLSIAKARAFKAIARAVTDGSCPLPSIDSLADDAAFAHLVAVKGIGPWTAEIYLLANLGRADVWPAGDLALQAAAADLLALPSRPDARAMHGLAAPWRPWRAVAARLLWSHYRGLKGMTQAVD